MVGRRGFGGEEEGEVVGAREEAVSYVKYVRKLELCSRSKASGIYDPKQTAIHAFGRNDSLAKMQVRHTMCAADSLSANSQGNLCD